MSLLDPVIIGAFTGFGSAIGNYFALKYAVQHMDKIPTVKEKIREIRKMILKTRKVR